MSAFLGPIHYWLYNKITLFEQLENSLLETYKEKYGESIQQTYDTLTEKYGQPIDTSVPLEEVIDTGNIHGWLQQKISIAETREAAFLTKIFNEKGQDAIDIATAIHRKQGELAGNKCSQTEAPETAPEIFKALNNYILDGMPCDQVNLVTVSEDDLVAWEVDSCLHIGYWNSVNADTDTFYMLRREWVSGFVNHANPNYQYTFTQDGSTGQNSFVHQISKR